MAKRKTTDPVLVPDLQIDFAARLQAARTSILKEALAEAVGRAALPT